MKRTIALALVFMLAFSFTACSDKSSSTPGGGNNSTPPASSPESSKSTNNGEPAIRRGPDDDTELSVSTSEEEGFMVILDGNTSVDNTLCLTSEFQYFYIKVVNTGDNAISITIGNDSSTQSANYYQIQPGTYYICSAKEWAATSHTVSFSSNNGMSGNAYAYLCNTLAEAEIHS